MVRYGIRITAEKDYFENAAIRRLCRELGSEKALFRYFETGEMGILEIMALDEEATSSIIKFYELYLPEACIGVGKNKYLFSVHT
jgi:hypothetical protein